MKRFACVALVLGVFLQGCQRPARGPGQEITGMVLNPGVRLQTAQNMIVRAGDRAGGRYSFVFGPYLAEPKTSFEQPDLIASGGVSPSFTTAKKVSNMGAGPSTTTMAVFSTTGATAQPTGAEVEESAVEVFQVDSGVSLLWGIKPKVRSRRVYIGGDGTEFMLYVEPPPSPWAPTSEHIVLVDPSNTDRARIYKLDSAGQPTGTPIILANGHLYARLNPDGTFTLSDTVPPDIQAVVDYAKQQAATSGSTTH
ncbi:MAG: hypothetical protein IT436_18415 [Phycisphaerales bacterium]|nr:hypothetical protein [Phycisphaerales bacterium]